MRVLAIREAKTGLSATLDDAQRDRVLITRNGKPCAIVIGVEGHDLEDVMLMSNPRFWRMIEASRKDPKTYSLDEVRAKLEAGDVRPAKRQAGTMPRGAKRPKVRVSNAQGKPGLSAMIRRPRLVPAAEEAELRSTGHPT
jgi:antitoxin (DNA-binding transcriptional repressor) of toxin-antitoxin stability system